MKTPKIFRAIFILSIFVFICGCRTTPLPPENLSAPGWKILQGQAVWQPPRHRPEFAGDLILATNANGNYFLQFSKSPFTLATAQIENGRWQMEFGNDRYSWRGSGAPPNRFVWFQLPRALASGNVAANWEFGRTNDSWRLENPRTGESLEGEFFQ